MCHLHHKIRINRAVLKISGSHHLVNNLSSELYWTWGDDTRPLKPPSDKPEGLRTNHLRKQTIHVGGKRPNSEPFKWQISMQGKWMHKETLSYCTVKSINLSQRSEGLLAGINHSERQEKKIQGTGWQWKKLPLLPRPVSSDWVSEIAHICPCYSKKTLFRGVSFTGV